MFEYPECIAKTTDVFQKRDFWYLQSSFIGTVKISWHLQVADIHRIAGVDLSDLWLKLSCWHSVGQQVSRIVA